MATDFTEETAADAVIESFAPDTDPRLREILTSLVRHLHAFAREVELTIPEWEKAIDFLTRTGHKCDDDRQEFILLSDVLGLSMLVETISNRKFGVATESTVLGPFHVVESPGPSSSATTSTWWAPARRAWSPAGSSRSTAPRCPAPPSTSGRPTTRASTTCSSPTCSHGPTAAACSPPTTTGEFWFRTIVPSYYPIPTDGPVGELLNATGRHAFRPAHIHFIVEAPGHRSLTTHIFVAGSEYIESDTVFAVKKSLVADFEEVTDEAQAAAVERRQLTLPPRRLRNNHATRLLTPRRVPPQVPLHGPASSHTQANPEDRVYFVPICGPKYTR